MDKRLLDILCCPVSRTPLRMLHSDELKCLNDAIAAGQVMTVAGAKVADKLADGLVTTDAKVAYPIADGIPVLLPEEGIGTTQLQGFGGP